MMPRLGCPLEWETSEAGQLSIDARFLGLGRMSHPFGGVPDMKESCP